MSQVDMFAHGLSVEQKHDNEGGIQNLYSSDINDESKVLEGQIHSESTTLVSSTFKGKVSLAENSPYRVSQINLSNLNSSFKPSSGLQQLDLNKVLEDYILRSDHDKIVADKDKLIEEVKYQLKEQKATVNKLEEKVETKDQEILQLRKQVGGSEVQDLKIKLAEVTVRLDERDKQLREWKDVADKLMKSKATFEKWKQQMEVLSGRSSTQNSQQQTPSQSQNDNLNSDIDVDEQMNDLELFGFQNVVQTCYAGAALQCIQAIQILLCGKLAFNQFLTTQSLRKFYQEKLSFPSIFNQNDSAEALLQFMNSCISDRLTSIQLDLKRNTRCRQCNTVTQKHEIQLLLQLPCSHQHLSDCFRTYLMKESLVGTNQFECNTCCIKTDSDTWLNIDQANDILLIQLNRFASDGINTKKRNNIIEMPLKFVLNNQQYELFIFVVHFSQNVNEGHYIAYSQQNGIWNKYDDAEVTENVDITRVKDQGYYYCYRRVVKDYAASIEKAALENIVDKQCVYCGEVIRGPATYHVPNKSEIYIAGAMVEHLKQCKTIVSSSERIRLALKKHGKEIQMLNIPQQDIRKFFSEASQSLNQSLAQISSDTKIVRKAARKVSTKVLKTKAQKLPTQQELEADFIQLEKLKTELAGIACTWNYKWDPLFVERTPHIIVNGEIAWAGYVPPAIQCISGAVCDEEGNVVYGTNTTRENVYKSIYGKKRGPYEKKLERHAKITAGVPLTLIEYKAYATDNICRLIEKNKGLFQQFQDWMLKYKVDRNLSDPDLKKFEWVGSIFCDGIIVPKLPIFTDNCSYQAFLEKHGKLEIQKISDSSTPGCLYVRLLDSANCFTESLIEGLNKINRKLACAMNKHLNKQNLSINAIAEALKECCIRQVDYTRDIKGAFYSYNKRVDFDALANLLKMRKATNDEYTSIDSCFQFLNYKKGQPKDLRMKFYNKIFHLIQSEQGKKKVSMNLKALLSCSAAFFRKLDECITEGLSRCEFSQYFQSAEGLKSFKFENCSDNLDKALETLNKVPQVYNTIPCIAFLDDYFETFASNLFIFEQQQWAVVYGKNRVSSYMGIIGNPCKMGKAEFIARFTHNQAVNIIDNTAESVLPKDTLVVGSRVGPRVMQIPMQSLGVVHKIKNMFDLEGTKLKLRMTDESVQKIIVLQQDGCFMFKPHKTKQSKRAQLLGKRHLKALEKQTKHDAYFAKVQPKKTKLTNFMQLNDIYDVRNAEQSQEPPRKRETKFELKQTEKEGITEEVTSLMVEKRVIIEGKKVRRLFMNGYPDCSYSSKDQGITYMCAHCGNKLKREQKTRLFKI